MYSRWLLFFGSALLLHNICCNAFLITNDPECLNSDNETYSPKEKCLWLMRFQRNLGKYRNFYANLLQEENQQFAVEIQELYNLMSNALKEKDLSKKHRMLFYSIWLVESTKNLEDYLIDKGLNKI